MVYAVACLAIAVFMAALIIFRIVAVATDAVNISRGVMRTLSDPELDDTHREKAMQKASLSLLGKFVSITIRGAAALLLSFLAIYLADLTGMADTQEVVTLLSSPEAIIVTTVILTAAWFIWKKR